MRTNPKGTQKIKRQAVLILLFLFLWSTRLYAWSLPFFHHDEKKTEQYQNKNHLTYRIQGLPAPATKNALLWLKADDKEGDTQPTTEDIHALYTKSAATILQAIQPFGLFKANIRTQSLQKISMHEWQATYQVNPGEPLRITSFHLTLSGMGAGNSYFQTYLEHIPVKQGQIFNTEQYKAFKTELNHIATQHGFLAGRFSESTVKINLSRYRCDIELHYDTGPQYYFGSVLFKQDKLNDAFLQRFVPFKAGTPYSPDLLMTLEQRLSTTPYFQSVSVESAETEPKDVTVPVTVNLVPTQSERYDFGLGYGTDTGIRGTLGWVLPRVTRNGQYFTSQLQASQIQTNLDTRYIIPGQDPTTQQDFIAGSITQESPNTSNGQTEKISVGHSDVWYGWKTVFSLAQQFDHYSLRGDPWQRSHLLLPEISFNQTHFDNPIFPSSGHALTLKIKGASSAVLSSTSFVQTDLSGKWIMSPTDKSRLLLRGELGLTAVNNINTIPLSLQFFAGGSDSVRGYSYQELGPGKYLLVSSVEYQHQVIDKWYGAVFCDMGNAVNSWSDPAETAVGKKQPNDLILSDLMKESIGIGVVWVSPVGPMELTLAKPLSDPGKSVSVQFSMGTGL